MRTGQGKYISLEFLALPSGFCFEASREQNLKRNRSDSFFSEAVARVVFHRFLVSYGCFAGFLWLLADGGNSDFYNIS